MEETYFRWRVAAPGGRWREASQSKGDRKPDDWLGVMGRDVIAITSVGGRISERSVTLPGSIHAPRRTAVMAMTALPMSGGSGWRLAVRQKK